MVSGKGHGTQGDAEIIPLICERTERQHFRKNGCWEFVSARLLQSQQVWLPAAAGPLTVEQLVAGEPVEPLQQRRLPIVQQMIGRLRWRAWLFSLPVMLISALKGDFSPLKSGFAEDKDFNPFSGATSVCVQKPPVAAATILALSLLAQ